jgi:hypothetical protein
VDDDVQNLWTARQRAAVSRRKSAMDSYVRAVDGTFAQAFA